jgi:hypothetical protein
MLSFTPKFLVAAFATILFAVTPSHVAAHGSIVTPTVSFQDPYNRNAPSAMISGQAGPVSVPQGVKELADANGSTCGKTNPNAGVQPIPADNMLQLKLTALHIGPCEVWLDDVKVASAESCKDKYPPDENTQISSIPVDFSPCRSKNCLLRWVWLATHNSPWEMYDNCVTVGGGGSSAGGNPASPSTSLPPTNPTPVSPSAPGSMPMPAGGNPSEQASSAVGPPTGTMTPPSLRGSSDPTDVMGSSVGPDNQPSPPTMPIALSSPPAQSAPPTMMNQGGDPMMMPSMGLDENLMTENANPLGAVSPSTSICWGGKCGEAFGRTVPM